MIAPIAEDWRNIYIGIKEFSVERVVLVFESEYAGIANKLAEELEEKFNLPVERVLIAGDLFEEFFALVASAKERWGERRLLINVASGDKLSACIALSAAFVNGVLAFGVKDGKAMLFPVLRFSYSRLISEQKIKLMEALRGRELTPGELAEAAKMSPSLVSYHLHGSRRSEGLISLGLVEMQEGRARLTQLGKMALWWKAKQQRKK